MNGSLARNSDAPKTQLSASAKSIDPQIEGLHHEVDYSNIKVCLIVNAAKKLFFTNAYDAVSMESVAALAGVSKGTLYCYFKNKEELFASLIMADLATVIDTSWCQTSEISDVKVVLKRVARSYVALFGTRHAIEVYRSLVSVSAKFPRLGCLFYERSTKILVERLADYISDRNIDGVLYTPDPELAAQQFLSLVRGNLHLREVLSSEPPSETERENLIDAGVTLFLSGYGVAPSGSEASSERN